MFKCFFARKMKDVKYVKDLSTSTKGKIFIKQYESCKLNAYVCPAALLASLLGAGQADACALRRLSFEADFGACCVCALKSQVSE